jgi:hypothetical protein
MLNKLNKTLEKEQIKMENLKVSKIEAVDNKAVEITLENGEIYKRNWFKKANHKAVTIKGIDIEYNNLGEVINQTRKYEVKDKKNVLSSSSKKTVKAVDKKLTPPEFKLPDGEVHHEKYETIKMCLMSDIPVYLAGPAGSGKNHTVEQIARELGWDFYFSNSVQQEYKLTGFIDAGGEFHSTEFYKACMCDNDCVFFLDEMDASIPEVLVLLNAAIANGYFEFPNGRVDLKHVHFVAAGNTVGSGADEMYTGRMVLDQATLDRFAIIEFDYSINIEMSISKGNTELVNFIHELRKQANSNGIRATFSYRCITMVTKLEKAGMSLQEILLIAVVKGLDKDTINTFRCSNPIEKTKYDIALEGIKKAV